MPDDLDLSRSIEALTGSETTDRVGRFRLDLRTGRWSWSDELFAIHALAPDAAPVASTLLALRHPDDRGADPGPVIAAITAGSPFASSFRVVTPTGDTRMALLLGEPERDADGVVIGVHGHLVELTAAAQREAELRERAGHLETALRTRPVIEQAKGMLMLMHRCSEEAAFRLLIGVSQARNRKLRDVAAEIVEAMSRDDPLPEPTAQALGAELAQVARRDGADRADGAARCRQG